MSPEYAALVALFITAIAAPFVANWQNNRIAVAREQRDNARQDRVAAIAVKAAKKVQQVATTLEKSNKTTTAQGAEVLAVSKATHAIVNNQRTQMLRQIAVLTRAAASDHPTDKVLAEAAAAAEADLAKNVEENADPATKVGGPGHPLRVEVVNVEPVQVDQVDKPVKA